MKRCEPTATDRSFANAAELRVRIGSVEIEPGLGIPTGIPHAPVHEHVLLGLRECDWPLTKLSLRRAQARGEAAKHELWTEKNA